MQKQSRTGKHKDNNGSSAGSEELTKVSKPTPFRRQRGLGEESMILGHLLQESPFWGMEFIFHFIRPATVLSNGAASS